MAVTKTGPQRGYVKNVPTPGGTQRPAASPWHKPYKKQMPANAPTQRPAASPWKRPFRKTV
jgi:hypothetical protein